MPISPYRSPRNPDRFRVLLPELLEQRGHLRAFLDGDRKVRDSEFVYVCEGLAKPKRRAHWRLVCMIRRGPDAAATAKLATDPELGYAMIPGDCAEVDFVTAAGEVLK